MTLVDDPEIHSRLAAVAFAVSSDTRLHEDLIQEALVHLWRQENLFPGHTHSWYLQNCCFYLCDYLRRGRSLDSCKRNAGAIGIDQDLEEQPDSIQNILRDDSGISAIIARDIVEELLQRLKAIDRVILLRLDAGAEIKDIAQELRISRQAVSLRRQKIAALAVRLGVSR